MRHQRTRPPTEDLPALCRHDAPVQSQVRHSLLSRPMVAGEGDADRTWWMVAADGIRLRVATTSRLRHLNFHDDTEVLHAGTHTIWDQGVWLIIDGHKVRISLIDVYDHSKVRLGFKRLPKKSDLLG